MSTIAQNPRWSDAQHVSIILDVQFEEAKDFCAFVAAPDDCTTHGPMLYSFALQGLFGEVKDSDEERILRGEIDPPEGHIVKNGEIINLAQAEKEAQEKLNGFLAELNSEKAKAKAETNEDFAKERKIKLTALLAVEQQSGWPLDVDWPA